MSNTPNKAAGPSAAPSTPAPWAGLTLEQVGAVSPALAQYTQNALVTALWQRPGLSVRDRSIVTVAALIARHQADGMPSHFATALENGVTPAELSEIITHLAFYTGWPNAMAALPAAKGVFSQRGIAAQQLPSASPKLLPLDDAAEAQRASRVSELFAATAPEIVQFTTDLLFRDLWLRPDLAPRDRSLVTVSALIASGQVAQIPYHLNRAMDSGLTQQQAAEVVTHLAFYSGWPSAFSALPVIKEIFEKRPR